MRLFIVGAKRTPFGAFGGQLKGLTATDLAVKATTAALSAAKVNPAAVDTVCIGNVQQTSPDAAYLARHVRRSKSTRGGAVLAGSTRAAP